MSEQNRVFIYGSEAVAYDSVRRSHTPLNVTRFVTRQSVISAMSRPVTLEAFAGAGVAEKRALGDARGSLLDWVRLDRNSVDFFVWELSDERFGVERCGDDMYRTMSPDYGAFVDQLEKYADREYIPFGSDEHFALFKAAASRFVAVLNAIGLGSRTIVLAPESASASDSSDVLKVGSGWRRYWRYLHDVCALTVTVLPESVAQVDEDHRWGPAPFHFDAETLSSLAGSVDCLVYSAPTRGRASRLPLDGRSAWLPASRDVVELDRFDWIDGVHRLRVHDVEIDVLVNFEGRKNVSRTPVFFSGALSPGQVVDGPVFSGRELCRNLELPLVAIADPSIGLRPEIDLAWYAGSEWTACQAAIDEVLDSLSAFVSGGLLLVGGSGGGFAALDQVSRSTISGERSALVWNPQLDIAKYGAGAVSRYLATCFPGTYLEFGSGALEQAISAVQERYGVSTELFTAAWSGRISSSLVLQQRGDWHFSQFIVPLLEGLRLEVDGVERWAVSGDLNIVCSSWGEGHVPPPRKLLEVLLDEGASTSSSMLELARLSEDWFSATQLS